MGERRVRQPIRLQALVAASQKLQTRLTPSWSRFILLRQVLCLAVCGVTIFSASSIRWVWEAWVHPSNVFTCASGCWVVFSYEMNQFPVSEDTGQRRPAPTRQPLRQPRANFAGQPAHLVVCPTSLEQAQSASMARVAANAGHSRTWRAPCCRPSAAPAKRSPSVCAPGTPAHSMAQPTNPTQGTNPYGCISTLQPSGSSTASHQASCKVDVAPQIESVNKRASQCHAYLRSHETPQSPHSGEQLG